MCAILPDFVVGLAITILEGLSSLLPYLLKNITVTTYTAILTNILLNCGLLLDNSGLGFLVMDRIITILEWLSSLLSDLLQHIAVSTGISHLTPILLNSSLGFLVMDRIITIFEMLSSLLSNLLQHITVTTDASYLTNILLNCGLLLDNSGLSFLVMDRIITILKRLSSLLSNLLQHITVTTDLSRLTQILLNCRLGILNNSSLGFLVMDRIITILERLSS